LRDYISELIFFRAGDIGNPPIPFQIPKKNIHIEWPDNVEDLVFPSLAFLPSKGMYDAIGLTSYIEEETRDVFAPGTVLQWQSEYTETFQIEAWASKKAERRALIACLESDLVPTEQMYGVRFTMPDYYNEQVCFTLMSRTNIDDADSAKNRRRARLDVEMRYTVVRLVNYSEFQPQTYVELRPQISTLVEPTLTTFEVHAYPDVEVSLAK
jgi:hypothetical protein